MTFPHWIGTQNPPHFDADEGKFCPYCKRFVSVWVIRDGYLICPDGHKIKITEKGGAK